MGWLPQIRAAGWLVTGRDGGAGSYRYVTRHLFVRLEQRIDATGQWTLEVRDCARGADASVLTALIVLGSLLVVAGAVTMGPAPASAATDPDAAYISVLRSTFGVTTAQATDAELDMVLEAPVGKAIKGIIALTEFGQQSFTSNPSSDVTDLLRSEVTDLSGFSALVDEGISEIAGIADAGDIALVLSLVQTLSAAAVFIDEYVSAYSQIVATNAYKELIAGYEDFRLDGGEDPDQAWTDVASGLDGDVAALEQIEDLSSDQIHAELELVVQGVLLASNPIEIREVGGGVAGVVAGVRNYENNGGAATGAIALVDRGSQLDLINDGPAALESVTLLDSGGGSLGGPFDFASGQSQVLDVAGGASSSAVASLSFRVDGIGPVTRSTAGLTSLIYFEAPLALVDPSSSASYTFTLPDGQHVANGATASYQWAFGDGQTATGLPANDAQPHTYTCPGSMTASLTGTVPGQSFTRTVPVTIPTRYNLAFTTDTGVFAVAPGVPLSFSADPSIPTDGSVDIIHPGSRKLLAIDYDTVVRLDAATLDVEATWFGQEAAAGTAMFLGGMTLGATPGSATVARPGSGDVVSLDLATMMPTHSWRVGGQPLEAVELHDQLVARDWKSGALLSES